MNNNLNLNKNKVKECYLDNNEHNFLFYLYNPKMDKIYT
jgi:hypothetical protein